MKKLNMKLKIENILIKESKDDLTDFVIKTPEYYNKYQKEISQNMNKDYIVKKILSFDKTNDEQRHQCYLFIRSVTMENIFPGITLDKILGEMSKINSISDYFYPFIEYNIFGDINKIIAEYYFKEGKLHREESEGAALIRYYPNNKVFKKIYYKEGLIHRENNLPAFYEYYKNGSLKLVEYRVNNKLHRENGAAIIEYDERKNIISYQYYLNGKQFHEIKYKQMIKDGVKDVK